MKPIFQTATQFFAVASRAVYLFKNIWREGSVALLHSPREVDKSSLALSIASDVARAGKKVLYVSTSHCVDLAADKRDALSDNLLFYTPRYESPDDRTDYADLVFEALEEAVATTDIRVFVIDSVSRIAALSFGRNASAAYIMKRLAALQVRCGLSILVLADDTTRAALRSLTILSDCEIPLPTEDTANQKCTDTRPECPIPSKAESRPIRRDATRSVGQSPNVRTAENQFEDSRDVRPVHPIPAKVEREARPVCETTRKAPLHPVLKKLSRRDRRILRRAAKKHHEK